MKLMQMCSFRASMQRNRSELRNVARSPAKPTKHSKQAGPDCRRRLTLVLFLGLWSSVKGRKDQPLHVTPIYFDAAPGPMFVPPGLYRISHSLQAAQAATTPWPSHGAFCRFGVALLQCRAPCSGPSVSGLLLRTWRRHKRHKLNLLTCMGTDWARLVSCSQGKSFLQLPSGSS